MAITIKGTPYKDFTSITLLVQPTGLWPAVTAERLILIITSRAWTAGATRTITATYGGVNVPVVATNSLTPAVTSFDIVWWVGELANPTTAKVDLVVTADGTTRGLNTVGYFVDGAKSTGSAIILDSQASDTNGNTVVLSGTPSAVGGLVVNSSMMAKITTISSFTPGTWSIVQEGSSGPSSQATSSIRHDPIVSLTAITATTQWVDTDVQRGGVLVEIAPASAPAASIDEAVVPLDSASAVVAATATQTDAATASDSASSSVPSDTTPENPAGVYQAATAAWKLPSGADVKGANPLTSTSGMSAASLKGNAATLTTASFARRTNPAFAGGITALSFEFWVRPAAFSSASTLIYLGPPTPPPPPPSSSRLFAAGDIDDAGTNIVAFASHLNNLMSATPTAKFMPLGDLVYPDGATSEYTRYNGRFSGIKSRTIPCPGNHDYGSSGPAPYLAYFSSIYAGGPAYFRQVIDANWVVYSLNTNISMTAGSAQGVFLETQLSAETFPGRIFITHHPWKSSGTTHGPTAGLSHLIDMAKTHTVSLWIVAHEHHYERFARDTGVRTVVVGTGGHSDTYSFGSPAAGSEVRNGSKGVLQLDLRSTDYTGLFLPVTGSFADTFTDPINGL